MFFTQPCKIFLKLADKTTKTCTSQMFDVNNTLINGACNVYVWYTAQKRELNL